ncbi:MAG: hypothetical protein GY765_19675, partial [bacterium]|nr:hypothetical protein [bacterium]
GSVIYNVTGSHISFTDTSFETDSYYYVRAIQRNVDGSEDRAWSSPIWVSLAQ